MTVTPYMPSQTPVGGKMIDVLRGDPDDVKSRGQQIVDLGTDMANAWNLISRLVSDGAEMEGQSIEKLRELCEKVSSDLSDASELYAAVGPHILTYGTELETSKGVIDPLVTRLQELWDDYYTLSSNADTAEGAVPREPDDDADADEQSAYDTASANADEKRGLATAKKTEWDEAAGEYDTAWDDWFDAFDRAAKNIKEGVSGKIEDSWKDDLRGALDFLANVLAVAGIVLAVLAIVIGGPIIAALAAIVAVATLAVALTRKLAFDDGSWLDVAFGVIGVIPFIGPAARTLRGLGTTSGWRALGTAFGDDFMRLSGAGATSFDDWASGLNALRGTTFADKAADFSSALFTGKNMDDWARMGSTGRDALNTISTVWVAQFQLVGQVKDASTGAFPGSFDPDQNPFS
jgi:hypothetical protein